MNNLLPKTAAPLPNGHLEVGGCDATDLAQRFGTPLLVMDRMTFQANVGSYTRMLEPGRVFFATKAFCCVALCEELDRLGLGLDVCSGGELATAQAAGFPADRIVFHGNNKSFEELLHAQEAGVGRLVIDSFDEIDRIGKISSPPHLLIRVTPDVLTDTHEFVQTGQGDSKFGFALGNGIALSALERLLDMPNVHVIGLHSHIGSQIFDLSAFRLAAGRLAGFLETARHHLGYTAVELNLGGGLGIAHTSDQVTPRPEAAVTAICEAVTHEFRERGLPWPRVSIEPGRSIAGPAGLTLYTVGTVKRVPGGRTFVSVDGGMSDNIRPALYGARYEAFLANRMEAPLGGPVTVTGKHCESGDVLIRDAVLPEDIQPGDLLCIPATGAYTYSMASNYNRIPKPAVVMVASGDVLEIIRRENYGDMVRLDRHLDGTPVSRGIS